MLRVLILGATSSIARALAIRFAAEGASLYLASRDATEAARVSADVAVRTGATVHSGAFDACDFGGHESFLREAVGALGGLDGAVVCFGTLGDEEAAQTESALALATIASNFTGAVSLMTPIARHLENQHSGFLIVIGSVAGERGRARNYVYGSAKGGLHLFTQGMRARLSGAGVHVMTVKLGTVDTRMTWGSESAPLSISPDRAADLIFSAYRRRADVVFVPWFWRVIMGVICMIPERIFKRMKF
jgi:hypothetical protein